MLCTQMDGDGYLQNREQDLLRLIVEKFNNSKNNTFNSTWRNAITFWQNLGSPILI